MNRAWKHLAGNIFDGADPDTISVEEISLLLSDYPYFAGLHLLKAAKYHGINNDEALKARSRAALYFQNPHWFQSLLSEPITIPKHEPAKETETTFETPVVAPELPVHHEEAASSLTGLQEAETEFDDRRIEPAQEWETALAENPVFQYQQPSDEEAFEQQQWQHHQEEESVAGIQEPEEQVPSVIGVTGDEEEVADEIEVPYTPAEDPDVEVRNIIDEVPVVEVNMPVDEAVAAEVPPAVEDVPAVVAEGPADIEDLRNELTVEIPFEPLYTIDYFASQGIKYASDSEKDQLSIKLKSFTEWLKSMKRLHPEKVQHSMDNDQEAVVRESAETSNSRQPVLTEAMAEVYLKQGSREKAVEIYEKLSLLDPSKSAYFAVLIKEIKEK